MELRKFYSEENKEHWLSKINESDWDAAKFLYYLLSEGKFRQLVGEKSDLLLLTEGDELISFCTLAEMDDVQPTDLTPWIGWIYTFPDYRGRRLAGRLLCYAESLAKENGAFAVHISTNHDGLYEKYGYEFLKYEKDIEGEDTKVYIKRLLEQ